MIPKLLEMRNTIVKTLICSQERICANIYGNIMYIFRFDSNKVGEGLVYVALSRIRRRSDLILITTIKEVRVKPV